MENIVIVGSSGHAKVIIDIVESENKRRIAGLLDRYRKVGEQTLGYAILGKEEDLPRLKGDLAITGVIVAIGDNYVRSKTALRIAELCPDLQFVSAIHPKASIARNVSIGGGAVIMAGATANPGCSIGRCCILNTNSSLDHDSIMEDFSSLAPGVTVGGNCRIGGHTAISIGAVIIHGIEIGEHTVVGAGTTVLGNIASFKVAYGSPAKIIRERQAGEKYL